MTTSKLTADHLARGAVVYVRQSTLRQVREHTEGRRRQYELVEKATRLGFSSVDVIDDDQGRSGSGHCERPGFSRLVARVCAASVGALFFLEASRLARNGRDWHHLLDLCALVDVVLIDCEGTYHPRLMNDRLLLGLKGTMSEYELGLLQQRSQSALQSKAQRGELRFRLPPGYVWSPGGAIEVEPDERIVGAIRLALDRFVQYRSVRQTWLSLCADGLDMPVLKNDSRGGRCDWRRPRYHNLLTLLRNPIYAGAYAYGRTCHRSKVVDGRARKTHGHRRPMEQWRVLIRDHHEGYISWEQYLLNQQIIEDNAHMKRRASTKAGRGGRALLTGKVRCGRCGYMMRVAYGSRSGRSYRYFCRSRDFEDPDRPCIAVAGGRLDRAVCGLFVDALKPLAIESAADIQRQAVSQAQGVIESLHRELEAARYEARLAARRYEAVDPDQRLVARELERRWEESLLRTNELEARIEHMEHQHHNHTTVDVAALKAAAANLPEIWNDPATDSSTKQKITSILVTEVVVDIDNERREVTANIHWSGGRHTTVAMPRNKAPIRETKQPNPIDTLKKMAGRYSDANIALTLNRLRRGKRRSGSTWTELRVRTTREEMQLPPWDPTTPADEVVTRDEAAVRLGVCVGSVKRMIDAGILPADQVAPYAPWEIPVAALSSEPVVAEVQAIARRRPKTVKQYQVDTRLTIPFKQQ